MSTVQKLQGVIGRGFSDEESLIKQEVIRKMEAELRAIQQNDRRGYTIPPLDTVGANLQGKLGYKFRQA